jgi:predicted O-methyltransferase YrrM
LFYFWSDKVPVKSVMRAAKYRLIGLPIFPILNAPFRALDTWRRYVGPLVGHWLVWIFTSRADSNFTYELTERCKINLAASLAGVLQKNYAEITRYFREIETDDAFKTHLLNLWEKHPEKYRTDSTPLIGRRMVWYAIARATKPKVIVETGVDQGIGAVVLCAALMRNASEDHPGKYYGTDTNPDAGYFLQPPYSEYGHILYGDSIKSLEALPEVIDLFINDSDHSENYEQAEFELIKNKLSPAGIVLGDNSHVTPKLAEFSVREGRRFVFLSEEPSRHWYRGAGVGISFPKSA